MNVTADKIVDFFDRAMAWSFYALIFFLPISNALVETFTVLALLCYLIKRSAVFSLRLREFKAPGLRSVVVLFLRSFAQPPNVLNKPIAVWMGVCLFSIVISERPGLSWDGFLGKVLQNVFLYFNFVEAVRTRQRIRLFLAAFFSSSLLICLTGLSQYFLGIDFVRFNVMTHHRVNATFRAPNDFAAYLVIVIPVLLSSVAGADIFGPKKVYKLSILSVLLLALSCLGLTYSRGGWLALSVALVLFALMSRKFFKRVLSGLAGFLAIFTVKMIQEREHMAIVHLFKSFGRTQYWGEALRMIADRPLFGFGLNTYSIVARRYKDTWGGYPHNCYLQMTAELGLVGLISFLWILFRLYRAVWAGLRTLNTPQQRTLLAGTTAGFTGFLFHSAFDTFFYSVQLGALMWLVMGLIVRLISVEDA